MPRDAISGIHLVNGEFEERFSENSSPGQEMARFLDNLGTNGPTLGLPLLAASPWDHT